MLASEDFFLFSDLFENAIELPGFLFGDIPPGQPKDLDLHSPAGEIDPQSLSLGDLPSGPGLMPIDGHDAPVAGFLGQGASFDQTAFGQKEIQTQPSALESNVHVDLIPELIQPGLHDLGDLVLPGQLLQRLPVILQGDLPLADPVDHLEKMIAR
jgi:hypothetical protein